MKHSVATLTAIWCAAADTPSSRPINSAAAMNKPPSISTVTPIGSPVASSSRIIGQCGRFARVKKPSNRRRSANRFERHSTTAKPSICSHSITAEASPRPAAPISGTPSLPNVST